MYSIREKGINQHPQFSFRKYKELEQAMFIANGLAQFYDKMIVESFEEDNYISATCTPYQKPVGSWIPPFLVETLLNGIYLTPSSKYFPTLEFDPIFIREYSESKHHFLVKNSPDKEIKNTLHLMHLTRFEWVMNPENQSYSLHYNGDLETIFFFDISAMGMEDFLKYLQDDIPKAMPGYEFQVVRQFDDIVQINLETDFWIRFGDLYNNSIEGDRVTMRDFADTAMKDLFEDPQFKGFDELLIQQFPTTIDQASMKKMLLKSSPITKGKIQRIPDSMELNAESVPF